MSPCESTTLVTNDTATVAKTVGDFVDEVMYGGGGVDVDVQDLRKLVSSVTRLYAACSERADQEIVAIDATVSTTDAVMLACALLRAHSLNPFDLAIWFSRGRVGERPGGNQDVNTGGRS